MTVTDVSDNDAMRCEPWLCSIADASVAAELSYGGTGIDSREDASGMRIGVDVDKVDRDALTVGDGIQVGSVGVVPATSPTAGGVRGAVFCERSGSVGEGGVAGRSDILDKLSTTSALASLWNSVSCSSLCQSDSSIRRR